MNKNQNQNFLRTMPTIMTTKNTTRQRCHHSPPNHLSEPLITQINSEITISENQRNQRNQRNLWFRQEKNLEKNTAQKNTPHYYTNVVETTTKWGG